MSLRTGRPVATTIKAIINPTNLKIEAFYVHDPSQKNKTLILLHQDIRDVLPAGLVINDYDVLSEPEDLIRLKKIMGYDFDILGKTVVTENKKRLGKISDFATDPSSMYIQKLYVVQSIIKNFAGGSLSVDRNQIIEITASKIIIKDPLQGIPANSPAFSTAPAN